MKLTNLLLSPDGAQGGAATGTATNGQAGAGDGGAQQTQQAASAATSNDQQHGGIPGVDTTSDDIFGPATDGQAGGGNQQQSQNQQQGSDQVQNSSAPNQSQSQADGTQQQQQAQSNQSGQTRFTKEEIADILAVAGLGQQAAQQQQQVAAQQQAAAQAQQQLANLTPEQFEQMFNVWKPSPELVTQLRSDDPATVLKAFESIRNGLIKQAMTMVEYRNQQNQEALMRNYIEPMQQYVTEQQATAFRDSFFKEHPKLAPYEQLVDSVAAKLQSQGYQGATRKDIIDTYAKETRALLKTLNIDVDAAQTGGNGAGGQSQQQQQQQSSSNGQHRQSAASGSSRMSTLIGGGQGGSGGGSARQGAQQRGPAGMEVFDD